MVSQKSSNKAPTVCIFQLGDWVRGKVAWLYRTMSQELVTSDGLIAAGPSTSHDDYNAGEDPMEPEVEELSGNESYLLNEGSEEELPSSQVSPRAKSRHRNTRNPESLEHVLFRLENAATAKSPGPRKKNFPCRTGDKETQKAHWKRNLPRRSTLQGKSSNKSGQWIKKWH